MAAAGWFDDGTGRQRWWDGERWTDEYQDAQTASSDDSSPGGAAPLRVFAGRTEAGSIALRIYPDLIEFEHKNFVTAVMLANLSTLSYSKTGYPSVKLDAIEFSCANPAEVYEYLRSYLAGR